MKSRRLTFRFLVLSVFAAGAFSLLSVQEVNASCQSNYSSGVSNCDFGYLLDLANHPNDAQANKQRCLARSFTNEMSCISADAWQNWLWQVNLNIGDNFLILNEPNPICATYPDALVSCGSLPTAEEIEVCMIMVQQEQAHNNCP